MVVADAQGDDSEGVGLAAGDLAAGLRLEKVGDGDRREDRDDGDHDQELDERETVKRWSVGVLGRRA